jgi:hypothetical protein
MPIPNNHKGTFFFHFTHIENIESIVKNGLVCTNKKLKENIVHKNIAAEEIQHRRSEMDVTCAPFGKVHDYVPFYFTSRNPMFLSILLGKNIDQQFLVFFAVPIEKITESNVVFTDSSANTNNPPNFYNDPSNLDSLNWKAINSNKWSTVDEDEKHQKMAEVLILDEVPLDWIDTIIVWNENVKKEIIRIFEKYKIPCPKISYEPFNRKYFYYTKFQLGRETESLITGPNFLKKRLDNLINNIIRSRIKKRKKYLFNDVEEFLEKVEDDFCILQELKDVFELETDNSIHQKNVSDHTTQVVECLQELDEYENSNSKDQDILKISAYLHDIGKGPKSKWNWNKGIQKAYPDHPADAIPMLERILIEDFENITEEEIRKICLLVVYHDLVGDIICRGRDIQQIINIVKDENELNLLIALSLADVSSINETWADNIKEEVNDFKKKVLAELK